MVFQSYALYPHMTVADNMGFSLRLARAPKATMAERVGAAAGMLGLGSLLGRFPKQLSGGQRQRVAMGRAMVRQPKVFLFDEPLSNLDAKLRVADALGDQAQPSATEDDDGLRHPRPDRGHDHGRSDRGDARRGDRADRHAARALRQAGQPFRRRLHRLAGDEHPRRPHRGRRLRRRGRHPDRAAGPSARPRRSSASGPSTSASTPTGSRPRSSPSSRPGRRRRCTCASPAKR